MRIPVRLYLEVPKRGDMTGEVPPELAYSGEESEDVVVPWGKRRTEDVGGEYRYTIRCANYCMI